VALKVKSVTEVRDKWLEVTPQRARFYEKEAPAAASDWETNTIAAASQYRAAVTAGNIEQLFKGGVKKAGAAKYQRKVRDVGVTRFGQGVQAAGPDYEAGVSPYLDELAKITLPPRQPRGSEANLQRVREIMTRLHQKRLALRTAGA